MVKFKDLLIVSMLASSFSLQAEEKSLSILLPLYNYPSFWDESIYIWPDVAQANSKVDIIAIINPNDGPDGDTPNSDYEVGLRTLRDGGVTIIGYVSTCWANSIPSTSCFNQRSIADMKNDIKSYQGFNIDGIFFDEAASDEAQVAIYRDLSGYARGLGLELIVVNPGRSTARAYTDNTDISDIAVTYENSYTAFQQTNTQNVTQQEALLVYEVNQNKMQNVIDRAMASGYGFLYITDDNVINPWDSLPSYWEEFIDILKTDETQDPVDNTEPETPSDNIEPETPSNNEPSISNEEKSNAIFNWAENKYPGLFPNHLTSFLLSGFIVRGAYPTGNYLGTKNGNVFVFGQIFGGLLEVGTIDQFYQESLK